MSLISCPECKSSVFENVSKCPNCGHTLSQTNNVTLPENRNMMKIIIAVCSLIIVISLTVTIILYIQQHYTHTNDVSETLGIKLSKTSEPVEKKKTSDSKENLSLAKEKEQLVKSKLIGTWKTDDNHIITYSDNGTLDEYYENEDCSFIYTAVGTWIVEGDKLFEEKVIVKIINDSINKDKIKAESKIRSIRDNSLFIEKGSGKSCEWKRTHKPEYR